jgi:hypothetical protein
MWTFECERGLDQRLGSGAGEKTSAIEGGEREGGFVGRSDLFMARHRVRDEQRVEEWQEGVTWGGKSHPTTASHGVTANGFHSWRWRLPTREACTSGAG